MKNSPISLDLYFTDFVTKADRRKQYASDFTQEINNNAIILLDKVNSLLGELGITTGNVTSGWRSPSINAKTANAAKRSAHLIGKAVDLADNHNQDLAKLVASRPDLLRKYDLFIVFIETIEEMEEFFLGFFLIREELNIVHD